MFLEAMLSFKVLLVAIAALAVVSAESCSSGNTEYMCKNLNKCWSELGFGSRDDLKYLCEIQGFNYAGDGSDGDGSGAGGSDPMVTMMTPPRNLTVPEGASAAFRCSADNALKIVIQKSSEMSKKDNLPNGGSAPTQQTTIQEINEAMMEHKGWYTCTAYGVGGTQVSAEAYLDIKDVCADSNCVAPKTCKADPYTGTYDCMCPGDCDNNFDPVCGSDCASYFNECTMLKETCEKGLEGVTVASRGLCSFAPEQPRMISSPRGETFKRGAQLSLSASASGTPEPEFVWYVDGIKVGSGATFQGKMKEKFEGTWTVKASNCHGTLVSEDRFQLGMDQNTQEPVEPALQCCKVYGDPHILTFDGKAYDYMGVGTYVIAQDSAAGLWMVYGGFEKCGDVTKGLSCVTSITVFFEREKVQFLRMWRINNNGDEFMVPMGSSKNIGGIQIDNVDLEYVITIGNTGVVVKWDGIVTSQVCVSKCAGNVGGLCADANCDDSNEFAMRGFMNPYTLSMAAGSSSEFGNSWAIDPQNAVQEPEDGALSQELRRPCDFIPPADRAVIETRCRAILDLGAFEALRGTTIDSQTALQSCFVDGCGGLIFGVGCAAAGAPLDATCTEDAEALISAAMASGMTREEALAAYGTRGIDAACLMGMVFQRDLATWGVDVGEGWKGQMAPPCPYLAEIEVMQICPTL